MTAMTLDRSTAENAADPQSIAPPLPVEGHIVAAALAAEKMKGLCQQMLLVLQYAARDEPTFRQTQGELLDAWAAIDLHYTAYQAVLNCEGQA